MISFDLKDEIIPYLGGLINGVSKDFTIANNKLQIAPKIDYPRLNPESSYSSNAGIIPRI